MRYSAPRFTIITSVPLGRLSSLSVRPCCSSWGVTVMSRRSLSISSGSSTPKSLPVLGIGAERRKARATRDMVVPCVSSERMVMKNTMLKMTAAPGMPATTG